VKTWGGEYIGLSLYIKFLCLIAFRAKGTRVGFSECIQYNVLKVHLPKYLYQQTCWANSANG